MLWKPLVCILRLTEGSFIFRELNEKILLYSNISKMECCVVVSNIIWFSPSLTFPSTAPEARKLQSLSFTAPHIENLVLFITKGKKTSTTAFKQAGEQDSNSNEQGGEKDCYAPCPISNPAQIKMETGGVSLSGQKHSAKRVEKKDRPQEQGFLPASLLHSPRGTNRSPPGRPKAKEWFKKWITHLGPKFEGEDQRDPVYRFWSQQRGNWESVRREKVNRINVVSATRNKLAVQREDNTWSSLLSRLSIKKKQSMATG